MMQPINIMVGGPASEISLEEVEKHREEVWIGADFGATFFRVENDGFQLPHP